MVLFVNSELENEDTLPKNYPPVPPFRACIYYGESDIGNQGYQK